MATTITTRKHHFRADHWLDHKDILAEAGWTELDATEWDLPDFSSIFMSPGEGCFATIDHLRLHATRIEGTAADLEVFTLELDWQTPLSIIEALVAAADEATSN